jgi:hypothetical protein
LKTRSSLRRERSGEAVGSGDPDRGVPRTARSREWPMQHGRDERPATSHPSRVCLPRSQPARRAIIRALSFKRDLGGCSREEIAGCSNRCPTPARRYCL